MLGRDLRLVAPLGHLNRDYALLPTRALRHVATRDMAVNLVNVIGSVIRTPGRPILTVPYSDAGSGPLRNLTGKDRSEPLVLRRPSGSPRQYGCPGSRRDGPA